MAEYVRRECLEVGCSRAPRAFGMCTSHRLRRAHTGEIPKVVQQPVRDDVWSRVDAGGDCWVWTGDKSKVASGAYYGIIATTNGDRRTRTGAHRFIYELLVGAIPAGLQIDHLCRNTLCVNPDHLEAVPGAVNVNRMPWNSYIKNSRKTHCKYGHEFTPANTRIRGGSRRCITCDKANNRRSYLKQRGGTP